MYAVHIHWIDSSVWITMIFLCCIEENSMGNFAKVGLAIGGLVLLGLFSQIPVGEESLQRYQDIKGNPSRIDLGGLNPDQ